MDNSSDPIILRKQARELYLAGIGKTTLWRWVRDGKLPPPIRLSRCVVGWRKSTLEAFIASSEGLAK